MTFDQLVTKWQSPIGEWAISKGWTTQERDPDHPDKMRNVPRDMLCLLMLMVTELAELEAGLQNEDDANIREEVADFAIRAIQMRAEYGFTCKTESTLSQLVEGIKGGESLYAMVAAAAESWRLKTVSAATKEVLVWNHLAICIAVAATDNADDGARTLLWLDEAIAAKMKVNALRAHMHGKLA